MFKTLFQSYNLKFITLYISGQIWEKVQSSFVGSGNAGNMTPVKLVFSNGQGDENIIIKEENGNFKDLVVSKGAIMMTVNLKIPERIQKLNITSQTETSKTAIKLNGEDYLLLTPKSPPMLIVVHKTGL